MATPVSRQELKVKTMVANKAEMISPSGDPTAYRVRGSSIALRKEQASHIHIEKVKLEKMEAV